MKARYVAIAVDQLFNTILGGYPDETLSARAFRLQYVHKRWAIICRVIDTIFFWQKEHCFNSYLNEKQRKHLPINY